MAPDGLRRTSSLVISSPTKSSTPGKRPSKVTVGVVPDSQEGNQHEIHSSKDDVIDLSSDSDGNLDPEVAPNPVRTKAAPADRHLDPFSSPAKKTDATVRKVLEEIVQETETDEDSDVQPHYASKVKKTSRPRRTVMSDPEDDSEVEKRRNVTQDADGEAVDNNYAEAILVLNDPLSSRRPALRDGASPSKPKAKKPPVAPLIYSTPSGGQAAIADPSPIQTPLLPRPKGTPGTQAKLPDFFTLGGRSRELEITKENVDVNPGDATPSRSTKSRAVLTKKRKTKKELQKEKQAHLADYAQTLFDELNSSVFMNRLAKDTPLIWNNRLLATAGRAKWHKDSKGVETTCIELATKVLDCEERIRNTLSHEMCHLACWVINCNPKENHGRVWQGWVEEVMEKRPDIAISTKHSYDISYKYEWQCQIATCKKIYGRHSNSIDPANSICGVCKVGDLVPLFKTRARRTNAGSKLAADKTRDSPASGARRPADSEIPAFSPLRTVQRDSVIVFIESSSEDEIDNAMNIATVDPGIVVKPKDSTIGNPPADADKNHQKGRTNPKGASRTEDIRKLVTGMSIIDLTDE